MEKTTPEQNLDGSSQNQNETKMSKPIALLNETEPIADLDAVGVLRELRAKMEAAKLSPLHKAIFLEITYLRFHTWLCDNNVDVSQLFPNTSANLRQTSEHVAWKWHYSNDPSYFNSVATSADVGVGNPSTDRSSLSSRYSTEIITKTDVFNINLSPSNCLELEITCTDDGSKNSEKNSSTLPHDSQTPSPLSKSMRSTSSAARSRSTSSAARSRSTSMEAGCGSHNNALLESSCDQTTLSEFDEVRGFSICEDSEEQEREKQFRKIQDQMRNVVYSFFL